MAKEKIDKADVAYVLGILSIVFAFFQPIAGLILGVIGLVQSKKAGHRKSKKLNIIGVVLSAIFSIVSIYMFIINLGVLTPGYL